MIGLFWDGGKNVEGNALADRSLGVSVCDFQLAIATIRGMDEVQKSRQQFYVEKTLESYVVS